MYKYSIEKTTGADLCAQRHFMTRITRRASDLYCHYNTDVTTQLEHKIKGQKLALLLHWYFN